ncbi:MAG TPA: hypothetical protein VKY85_07705 [Candidatus Angelobacter sp.]|nr:hypothetical protein [Candidatus Angelobacter sp.]
MSEYLWHGSELLTLIIAAWKVISAANRVLDVLKDFPPHRHVNGHVIYPEGFQPSPIEELSRARRAGAD